MGIFGLCMECFKAGFTQFTQFILGCWMYTMPCAVAQVVSLAWTTFTGRVVTYDWACQVVSKGDTFGWLPF
eukprot:jgi/Chrzof1/5988/UNPLg00835.t1